MYMHQERWQGGQKQANDRENHSNYFIVFHFMLLANREKLVMMVAMAASTDALTASNSAAQIDLLSLEMKRMLLLLLLLLLMPLRIVTTMVIAMDSVCSNLLKQIKKKTFHVAAAVVVVIVVVTIASSFDFTVGFFYMWMQMLWQTSNGTQQFKRKAKSFAAEITTRTHTEHTTKYIGTHCCFDSSVCRMSSQQMKIKWRQESESQH